VKRLLREAFRTSASALPPGLDLVVVARPHQEWDLSRYAEALATAARAHAPG
jgi:ribonuclease P protein component